MRLFRDRSLARLMATLLLLGGLVPQVQTLFACQLMDEGAKPVCCCHRDMSSGCKMGGGCALGDRETQGDNCCSVSMGNVATTDAHDPGTACARMQLLDAPQPPPALVSSSRPDLFLCPSFAVFFGERANPTLHGHGGLTYLVTGRLRL